MRDSNPRLSGCKPDALATELTILVERAGLEPAIACLQSKCIPNCATAPGGERGTRTHDFRVANTALFQLS